MEKSNVKSICKAFLLAVFLPQVVAFGLIMIFAMFFNDLEALQNSYLYIFTMSIVAQICFLIIYLLYNKKNKISIKQDLKSVKSKVSVKNILLCILISIIAVFGLVYFVGMFDVIFYKIGYKPSDIALPLNTFGWFIVNVLISACMPAIFEELIFRGIIFKGLRKKGFLFSAIISSVMFMLVHQSLGSIVYPLIMGMVFALVVEKTGSILYSMIIHFCNNFIVLFIEYLGNIKGSAILPNINLWWQYLIAVIIAIISVFVIYIIVKKLLIKKCDVLPQMQTEQENSNLETAIEKIEENIQQKTEGQTVLYTVLIGFAFWLILVITSLM